jgi:ferritin-like metal-binding protein YciE
MPHNHQKYLEWLNNAYAMELDIVENLESQVDDFESESEVQEWIKTHIETSKKHAEMVKNCIERNGGDISKAKLLLGQIKGKLMGMTMDPMKDKMLLNLIANNGVENTEIATYEALTKAAESMDDTESMATFSNIISDEKRMAAEIMRMLPLIAQRLINEAD